MSTPTFKEAFCKAYRISSSQYDRKALFKFLSLRARLAYPFLMLLNPNAFHQERKLVEFVGKAKSLDDIQYDVDFYQHKYVSRSTLRSTWRFRISGKYLLSVAKQVMPRR